MVHGRDDGMKTEPAYGDVEGRQAAEHLRRVGGESDFLVGLTKRGIFDGLARFNHAAGQRHLSAVAHVLRADREDKVRVLANREQQQQPGRMSHAVGVEPRRPATARARRHPGLRARAREGLLKSAGENGDELGVQQVELQNSVICGQLLRGAAYDELVSALTTSAPRSA